MKRRRRTSCSINHFAPDLFSCHFAHLDCAPILDYNSVLHFTDREEHWRRLYGGDSSVGVAHFNVVPSEFDHIEPEPVFCRYDLKSCFKPHTETRYRSVCVTCYVKACAHATVMALRGVAL